MQCLQYRAEEFKCANAFEEIGKKDNMLFKKYSDVRVECKKHLGEK